MLITVGILTALIITRAVLFFTAKPKITVDYVAEYNRFSLPENYNPEDNAAELYQKAFDAFIEMPKDLRSMLYREELTTEEKEQLKKWLGSNAQAFDYFKQASEKPYYWIERFSTASPPDLGAVPFPELSAMRSIIAAYICDSEYKAEAGHFRAAFENLLTCYRAGIQKCRPNQFAMDQTMGYEYRHDVLQSAFDFLDQYPIEKKTLESLQTAFVSFIDNDKSAPSIQAGKLFVLDLIQQSFVYNKEGRGRWAWRNKLNPTIDLCDISNWRDDYERLKRRLYLCLMAPTQRGVVQTLDELTDLSESTMLMTPWEMENAPFDYRKRSQLRACHTVLYWADTGTYHWQPYHETKARTHALIAVLAVLRYHQESGRYPQSLEELVDAGYLQSLPMDPYSDGPLVYRVTEESFTLYSVGENLINDDGTAMPNLFIFPEPSKKVIGINYPDIVYWPVYRQGDFPAPPVDPNETSPYEEFLF